VLIIQQDNHHPLIANASQAITKNLLSKCFALNAASDVFLALLKMFAWLAQTLLEATYLFVRALMAILKFSTNLFVLNVTLNALHALISTLAKSANKIVTETTQIPASVIQAIMNLSTLLTQIV
jgi:hypothetical protein